MLNRRCCFYTLDLCHQYLHEQDGAFISEKFGMVPEKPMGTGGLCQPQLLLIMPHLWTQYVVLSTCPMQMVSVTEVFPTLLALPASLTLIAFMLQPCPSMCHALAYTSENRNLTEKLVTGKKWAYGKR